MLSFTSVKPKPAHTGYIAGSGDGIVTVQGKPSSRKVLLLDVVTLAVEAQQWSLNNGHYAFFGLVPDRRYMVMVRDYKKEFEPFVWDYVAPANDLTVAEQQALWATWQ